LLVVPDTNPVVFRSLSPGRLVDTRSGGSTVDGLLAGGGVRGVGSTLTVQVGGRGGVEVGAATAMLNVVAVDPVSAGFLTVFPCDAPRPNASTLNYDRTNVANAALTKLSVSGTVCVYAEQPTQLIVDTTGFHPAGSTYRPLTPGRLVDTRQGGSTVDGVLAGGGVRAAGSTLTVQVTGRGGVSLTAATAMLNVVAVDPVSAGFVTVFPCDTARPNASTLNYDRSNVANAAFTKLSVTGTACIYAEQATQLIVDVGGFHVAGDGYSPLSPARLVDTRAFTSTVDGLLAGGGVRAAGSTLTVQVGGRGGVVSGAATATLNIVAVDPVGAGFLTVYPCDAPRPNASTLNYTRANVANAALTKLSASGTVCIYNEQATQLIVDVSGYYRK
jgi:hypothetical protein